MKITKTQIDYLDRRLRELRNEKIKKAFPDSKGYSCLDLYKAIKSGEVKLKPTKDIKTDKEFSPNGYRACYISNLFDIEKFEEKYSEDFKARQEYADKLDKAMTDIMDKVVLSDLMIEEAVKEFMKL